MCTRRLRQEKVHRSVSVACAWGLECGCIAEFKVTAGGIRRGWESALSHAASLHGIALAVSALELVRGFRAPCCECGGCGRRRCTGGIGRVCTALSTLDHASWSAAGTLRGWIGSGPRTVGKRASSVGENWTSGQSDTWSRTMGQQTQKRREWPVDSGEQAVDNGHWERERAAAAGRRELS